MAETIIATEYSSEMKRSFINYSMSVITARAVPDVRDGLKPVQRRVLYAMNELGLNSDKPHRKSARIVGDAMGKYHPHGDSSIYESLVVLSQDFKKGMALVDGHGNFGSVEGDPAAAMRYTEARLKKFTQEVYLADLDKDVVDFMSNFDETEKEPTVLPVRVPNFLINGSDGIAVGMTTSTPPHNLAEIINAEKLLMDFPNATTRDLMDIVEGPDFPTGGIVTNKDDLLSIYETGKGKIRIRGKAEIVYAKRKSDKDKIVITEIPYTMIGANIGKFLSDIANLVETKKLPDIVDISNQSSKEGIRIELEIRKGADCEKILAGLLKKTKLEDTFGVNMLAISDGRPEVMGLKAILLKHIEFLVELNTRKYTNLLKKEKEKREVQEGLIRAVDIIDLIIEIIRGSKTLKMAKSCLVDGITDEINFKSEASRKQAAQLHFSETQAAAILELRLSRLIGLELLALQEDYRKTVSRIAQYEKILGSKKVMYQTIQKDLDTIRDRYEVPRRTQILNASAPVYQEEAPIVTDVVAAMNRFGYIKLLDKAVFEKNEEQVRSENVRVLFCKSNSRLAVFTKEGFLHYLKADAIPLGKPKDKGVPIDNLCNYNSTEENILTVLPADILESQELLFVTACGLVKRTLGAELISVKKTVAATKLADGDRLTAVIENPAEYLVLVTNAKHAIRFAVEEIPEQKKTAAGVRAMKLAEKEEVIFADTIAAKEKKRAVVDGRSIELDRLAKKKRDAKPENLK